MGELRSRLSSSKSDMDTLDFSDTSAHDVDDLVFEDCRSEPRWETEKEKLIQNLLKNNTVDVSSLENLCYTSGGLITDDLRKKLWPLFLGIETIPREKLPVEIQSHQYYNQVVLDVKRILKRFPPGIGEVVQADLQVKVTELIIRVLLANKELHYYQGFHDVAITLLLVLGEELSYEVLCKIAQSHFSLYMGANMEPAMEALNIVYVLIKKLQPDLYHYLQRSELGTIFCLPWAITWFGHVLNDYQLIVRLYDAFLISHRMAAVYLSALIVIHRSNEIFSTPCEMPSLHNLLSNIPEDLPFDELILKMQKLMIDYPPDAMEFAAKEMHQKMLQHEAEDRRKIIIARKPPIQNHLSLWTVYWSNLRKPLRSPAGKLFVLGVSVATLAWVFTYIKPGYDGF